MKRTCPIAVALVVLCGAFPAQAQSREPGVRDAARLFSPPAVQKADSALKALKRDGGWEVFIETIDALGNQTVDQRALADAQALDAHGLVVLIAKSNHKLAVQPSDSAKKVFGKEKLSGLVKLLTDRFKAKEYDRGLADAVTAIEDDARVVGVRDTAKMFSADAVNQANAALKAFRQKSKWQVIIETVDSLSGQSPSQRAIANGRAVNVRGLSIVVDKADHQL